jgi:hypothetical protein
LRRVFLEKELRRLKWASLRRTERTSTTADQVQLAPEERLSWVKRMYSEAVEKGAINFDAVTNQTLVRARGQPQTASRDPERGAAALMQSGVFVPVMQSGSGAESAPMDPNQAMESLLLSSLPVAESDFQDLAVARARAVREYLFRNGVEPERVFLTETRPGGVRSEGARACLELR